MKVWVYRSERRNGYYLYVGSEDALNDVPEALLSRLGKLELALELELKPDRRLASENAATVLKNIERQGYHLQISDPLAFGVPGQDAPPGYGS